MNDGSQREQLTLDGIAYSIEATPTPNGLHGSWLCSACGATGGAPSTDGSSVGAILAAKRDLRTHHHFAHEPR